MGLTPFERICQFWTQQPKTVQTQSAPPHCGTEHLGGFALSIVAGFFLFITQANRYAGNRAFQIKIVPLILAVINMLIFHFRSTRSIARWDENHKRRGWPAHPRWCCGLV